MARWILLAILTAAATYAVFFHELGDRPFSAHVSDVWRSPVMQQKVRMVERGVGSQWFAPPPTPSPSPTPTPAAAPTPRARPAAPRPNRGAPTASNAHGSHDEADRRSLNDLVNKLQHR